MDLTIVREWIERCWGSIARRRDDRDLEEELRSHLELADEPRRPAVAPADAVSLRHRHIDIAQAMESLRDQRGLPWIDDLFRDLRHATRLLRSTPVFTGVAIVSLALGIGANAAIFSLADALLLRPLPVPHPDAVVTVTAAGPEEGSSGLISYPNYRDLRQRVGSFDGLFAYRVTTVAFSHARDAVHEMRTGMLVSDNFFSALGVQPSLGRGFLPEETQVPGRDAVVVLSDDFWRGALGADPSVLQGVVWMNGVEFHVVGIAPANFTGTEPPLRPAFYVPAVMATRLQPSSDTLDSRDARIFQVKGRLRPAVSRRSAEADLATVWDGLARQFPATNAHRTIAVRTELDARIQSDPWDAITLGLLFALVALVLTIACANVASLMLGRMRVRSREMAIRLALGVSRSRLLRQLLTESLALALAGCVGGLVFAYGGIRFLQTIPVSEQIVIDPRLDQRALVFSLIAAVASACLFGIGPARRSLATDLVPALKTADGNDTRGPRTIGRNVLVICQVALAMVLLTATALVVDGFRKALVLDPGFRTDRLMMLSLDPSLVGYTPERTRRFYRELLDRARVLPNVHSATLTSAVPLDALEQETEAVVPEGYRFEGGQNSAAIYTAVVDEHYFDSMHIEIIGGRPFTSGDNETAPGVAIVNEQFAARYWPNQNAIGRRIRLPRRHDALLEIVGVTRTGKYTWIGEAPMPYVYVPFAQQPRARMSLLVESMMPDAAALAAPLREIVRTLDVDQPISKMQTYAHLYRERAVAVPGIIMQTVIAISLIGLTLALVGLYGLVAYSVSRRTREIGIRMAIGAARSNVLSMVLRQGLLLSVAGIALGGLASVGVARVLSAALVGVGPPNRAVYVIVPVALVTLTTAASYFPARRAAHVDPLVALRYE